MRSFDRYAWTNAISDLDPLQKATISGVAILFCLVLNKPGVSLFTLVWIAGAMIIWARIPAQAVIRFLLGELLFLGISIVGIAFGIGAAPHVPTLFAWNIGGIWIYTTSAMLWSAGTLLLRALGCTMAMSLLALTTPMVALIELFRRLQMPELLINLLVVSYRSIFVLLDSMERIFIAQDSRLGYARAARMLISAAGLGSRLFVESYLRSRQLGIALESRGYQGGSFQVLPMVYRKSPWALTSAALLAFILVLLWVST